jgi:thiosulfate/3-mercaptopyruvate sulfurtransferase
MTPLLISAEELKALIGKDTLVIDCRFNLMDKQQGLTQYHHAHIPGAYFFDLEQDLSSPVASHGGRHPLPDIKELEKKLQLVGAQKDKLIVVYDDSRLVYSAHAWWLLKYMGHNNVRILNGGFKAWIAINGAKDRRTPKAELGNFTAKIQPDFIVNRDDILNSKNLCLIDSREARRYQGLEEPIDPIAGCIEGAINYPWQNIVDEENVMKTLEWQKHYWQSLPTQENLVVYCGSGVSACVNLLSLHLCGINAKLYPGSWSDWCSYLAEEMQ